MMIRMRRGILWGATPTPSPVRWPGQGPDAACQGSDREEEAGEAKEKEGITRSTMRMRLGQ